MQQFRDAIQLGRMTGEADEVVALLAEDVVFRSPVVHTPYEGRAAVEPLLHAVVRVLMSSASRAKSRMEPTTRLFLAGASATGSSKAATSCTPTASS